MKMNARKFHRWLGTVFAVLFLLVSITGVVLQAQELFGEDEEVREAMEKIVSPQKLDQSLAADAGLLDAARKPVAERFGNAPVSEVDWQFKGENPQIVFHLDTPEKQRVAVDARTDEITTVEPDGES